MEKDEIFIFEQNFAKTIDAIKNWLRFNKKILIKKKRTVEKFQTLIENQNKPK